MGNIKRRQFLTAGLNKGMLLMLGAGFAATAAPVTALAQDQDQSNPMPAELRHALERQGDAPVLGNPAGDVTLVEFFDYNCGFCRKVMPTLQRLIHDDPKLRVVLREWPIFGDGSIFAAKASLASLQQGKYWQLHAALMQLRGSADETSVMRAVSGLSLDRARLMRDMESAAVLDHLDHSMALAEHIGLAGTPTFIAGNDGRFGDQPMSELKSLIKQARDTLG